MRPDGPKKAMSESEFKKELVVGIAINSEERYNLLMKTLGLTAKVLTCPQCLRDYEPDCPQEEAEAPWQRMQHQHPPYCSDKCFDEAISGSRPEYTYDEKGRRFEDGVRKLFADPPQ